MLYCKYFIISILHIKRQKHRDGKQAVQGNQVTELALNPGVLAPEIILNHSMLHWLMDVMNEC